MTVSGGFFVNGKSGGSRIAQIPLVDSRDGSALLSDTLLRESSGIFTLLVVQKPSEGERPYRAAVEAIRRAEIREDVLSEQSVQVYYTEATSASSSLVQECSRRTYSPSEGKNFKENNRAYTDRFGHAKKFVLIRPDLFVFASARDNAELGECLASLKLYFKSSVE